MKSRRLEHCNLRALKEHCVRSVIEGAEHADAGRHSMRLVETHMAKLECAAEQPANVRVGARIIELLRRMIDCNVGLRLCTRSKRIADAI